MVELINLMVSAAAHQLTLVKYEGQYEVYDGRNVIGYFSSGIYTDSRNHCCIRVYVVIPEERGEGAYGTVEIDTTDSRTCERRTLKISVKEKEVGYDGYSWISVDEIEGDLAERDDPSIYKDVVMHLIDN